MPRRGWPDAGGFRVGVVLTILSNSSQERRRLFGQHPQAHEELLVGKIIERPDFEMGSNEATTRDSRVNLPKKRLWEAGCRSLSRAV